MDAVFQLLIAHKGSNIVVGLWYESADAARIARRGASESKFDTVRFGPDSQGAECWIKRDAIASITIQPAQETQPRLEPRRIVEPALVVPGNGGAT